MQVTVLVEPFTDGAGYRARAGEPFSFSVEGATRPEAVNALEAVLRARIERGATILNIQLGPTVPLIRTSGAWPMTKSPERGSKRLRRTDRSTMRMKESELKPSHGCPHESFYSGHRYFQ
jgi:hypothetical protein